MNSGFAARIWKLILEKQCWVERKGYFNQEAGNLVKRQIVSKNNSKCFDGSWKFSKGEREINYHVRGSKTSLTSTESRLSSDWLIVRHCFRNLVLKQSCHPPHGWGALVPTEEFKDIVRYIPWGGIWTLTYICTIVSWLLLLHFCIPSLLSQNNGRNLEA